jgi:hypothetical protein
MVHSFPKVAAGRYSCAQIDWDAPQRAVQFYVPNQFPAAGANLRP